MKTKLIINRLFAYSEDKNKFFNSEFKNGVNIIHGKNTSGKSTVFQLILYAFGINDNNDYLREIIDEEIIVRVDCEITYTDKIECINIIRETETLYIKVGDSPTLRFNGINGNSSGEHIKLKQYMNQLFGFTLKLESKNGYNLAPIEAMFSPYYIPQSVGWVYIRKAFSGFEFYRNFKYDYLDYYLGIESFVDREEKQKLEQQLKDKESEIQFFYNMQNDNEEIQVTKLVDEQFTEISKEYIDSHKDNQNHLIKSEEKYIEKCNELTFYQARQSLLRKVAREHSKQNPIGGKCPTCNNELSFNITDYYKYLQEENDTESEIQFCKSKVKTLASEINSLNKKIETMKEKKKKGVKLLQTYKKADVTFNNWMKNKANIELINNLQCKLGLLTSEKEKITSNLKKYKTENEVDTLRQSKNRAFKRIFSNYLKELGVKELNGKRYEFLYNISAFPSQGVELHKTVLAYNFALNKLIKQTGKSHRFPFMLDAIFKEDVDQLNKDAIVKFIGKNKPTDTQIILSVAAIKKEKGSISKYNEVYFSGEAKLICIGDGTRERAFLREYDGSIDDYIEGTYSIME